MWLLVDEGRIVERGLVMRCTWQRSFAYCSAGYVYHDVWIRRDLRGNVNEWSWLASQVILMLDTLSYIRVIPSHVFDIK